MNHPVYGSVASGTQEMASQSSFRKRLLLLLYTLVLFSSAVGFVAKDWNQRQLDLVLQWGLLFFAPALIGWTFQRVRRQLAIWDGGEMEARFFTQRPRPLPRWLISSVWLGVTAGPLLVLFFRETESLVVMIFAFGGVVVAVLTWLWFDGHPVEIRTKGLVLDGTLLVEWQRISKLVNSNRADVLLIETSRTQMPGPDESQPHDEPQTRPPQPVEVFVAPERRAQLVEMIESRIQMPS